MLSFLILNCSAMLERLSPRVTLYVTALRLALPLRLVFNCSCRPMPGALNGLLRDTGSGAAGCWFGAAVGSGCAPPRPELCCLHQRVAPSKATTRTPVTPQERRL